MGKLRVERVNAIAELDRIGWQFEPQGDNEVRTLCPAHEDSTPSVQLNTEKNLWNCKASHCRAKGDIITFLAMALKVERSTMAADLAERYELASEKTINPEQVEKWHQDVWTAGPLLKALRDRGITDDMIRFARIGYDKRQKRITIPVKNASGEIVNVRRYLPGAPGPEKMRNTRGYGDPRVYQPNDLLKHDRVWICGGEIKALVAGFLLRPHGIGAVSVTAAEGTWKHEWNRALKGKTVFVCMDIDNAGKHAAVNLARLIVPFAEHVYIVSLPLDPEKHPKGDLNDFVAEGATDKDLLRLCEEAEKFTPETGTAESDQEKHVVELHETVHPSSVGKLLAFSGNVAAIGTETYLIPREVKVRCDRNQKNCAICPIYGEEPNGPDPAITKEVRPLDVGMLDMVHAPVARQNPAIAKCLGIPQCRSVSFSVRSHYRVHDTRLTPQLGLSSRTASNVTHPAFVVDQDVELNTGYLFTGAVHPHPANQQATLLIVEANQAHDSLDTYSPSTEELTELRSFRPEEWSPEGIASMLDTIYEDFERNVTRIVQRRDMHLVFDFAYHSVLELPFTGRRIPGWVNALVLGDSSQGKTETAVRLIEHYCLGERVDCKNASVAGLIGGLQQLGNKWFVSWGVIPKHDQRLAVLEEVKGLPIEVISKMTDMRSSGIAEIPKIERRRANARTRLVWISNPRSRRPISSYNFGCEAVVQLIGNLEDLRRFDAAIIVGANDLDADVTNAVPPPTGEPKFSSRLCQRLVLFAWTRRAGDILFEKGAEGEVHEAASRLCDRYAEELPLVDRGTVRHKLARLSAALAARTFSTAEELTTLLIRSAHVRYVESTLERIYSGTTFGYRDYSRAKIEAERLVEPDILRKAILATKHPEDFVKELLHRDEISPQDVADWCDIDRSDAQSMISLFVRKHGLFRRKRTYHKTPEFIQFLKTLLTGEQLQRAARKQDHGERRF